MKKIISLLVLFIVQFSGAQEIINTININDLNAKKIQLFNIFTSNDDKKVVHLLKYKRELHAYIYDEKLKPIGEKIFLEKFKNSRASISGHSNNENRFAVYLNDDNEKWSVLSLNFDTNEVSVKDYNIKLRSQDFLNSFSVDDSHYLVTIKKHSSTIFIHKLYPDGTHLTTEYDFSDTDFSGGLRSIANLHKRINATSIAFQADLVRNDLPLSLRSTNEKVKFYVHKDTISITVDNSRDYTYLLNLNKDDSGLSTKTINKEKMKERSSYEDSNSFLYNNHLFTIKSTFEELKLSIIDLSDLSVVKTYSVLKDEDIYFKNTPILNQKAGNKNSKEISTTENFLKKITNSKPAISVHKQNDNLVLTLGASKQDNSETETLAIVSIFAFGVDFTGITYDSNANAIDKNFLDYSKTKTTRFQTVLDTSFNQVKDTIIQENVFDKIKNYDLNNKIMSVKALYKLNNKFYYSYIDEDANQIKTIEFE